MFPCDLLVGDVRQAEPLGAVRLADLAAAPSLHVRPGRAGEQQPREGKNHSPDPRRHGATCKSSSGEPRARALFTLPLQPKARQSPRRAPRRCPASPPSASRGAELRSPLDCAQQTFISQMEDGKPTRAGWESSRAAPLVPGIESVAIKTREGGKEMFKKPPWGFRAAIRVPRRGILERCELGSPECAAKVGTRVGSPGREKDRRARVCARGGAGASAGCSGCVCVEVCVGDIRDPGETSASHRLREPERVLLK